MFTEKRSPLFIILACLLWAMDLLVRYPLTLKLNFTSIIFLESLLGLLFIAPWLIKNHQQFKKLSKTDWLLAMFLGGFGMTVAGYLFTSSIQVVTPGTFSFFQIFQPLLVIYVAHTLLKEKVDNLYVFWGLWVILSALLMHSQDIELGFLANDLLDHPRELFIAFLTMVIWGACTVAAKKLLMKHHPALIVGLRWIFAFIFSGAFLLVEKDTVNWEVALHGETLARFIFISAVAGILAMVLYYKGLKTMPAGQVSFIELCFPAFGMILSSLYTFEGLTILQLIGAASFFAFICLMLSRYESVDFKPRLRPKSLKA